MAGSVAANVAAIVDKARTSWLKNNEVLDLLEGFQAAGLAVCQEPPVRPEGGQLFLFDRRVCRFFRRDGHTWRKKPDGKTIRETHEKLKVGNTETLNCYYAHADQDDGLQRRCYWQLDPDKEHTVLVHYLCSTSSRAQPNPARAGSQNLDDGGAGRPRRESARQAAQRGGRRGLSQARLSPLATQSSLEGSLVSQSSGDASAQGLDPLAALPLVQGISLEQAAALPSLAQQYAMQQQMLAAVQVAAVAPAVAPPAPGVAHTGGPALTPLPPLAPGLLGPSGGSGNLAALAADIDPFGFPVAELQRPHAGVLYTGQRMASQLAAQQQPGLVAAGAAGGGGIPVSPLGRPLFKQESFSSEQHRALFREMSLGIQRETVEEAAAGYFMEAQQQPGPLVDALGVHDASGAELGKPAASPGPDIAALLSPAAGSGSGHRRSFSRQGSGLSRLISKNWESDLQMEMMLPDVDADISTYPVGDGTVIEVAPRPTSPSSRLVDQAGIAFFGSAGGTPAATAQHTLEPSPLAAAALAPAGPEEPLPGLALPFASLLQPGGGAEGAVLGASPPPGGVQFAAGEGGALAQRAAAVRDRSSHRDLLAAAFGGVPRSGSQGHLAHLARRSGASAADAAAGEEQEAARRKERAEAAATAAQEHRDEKLAELRSKRLASDEAADAGELIHMPGGLQRLASFLGGTRQGGPLRTATADKEAVAALQQGIGLARTVTEEMQELGRLVRTGTVDMVSAEALEAEARSLLKHMSIDEVDAVAAVQAWQGAKELEVMPTIPAAPSSDLEVASAVHSLGQGSTSEDGESLHGGLKAPALGAAARRAQ